MTYESSASNYQDLHIVADLFEVYESEFKLGVCERKCLERRQSAAWRREKQRGPIDCRLYHPNLRAEPIAIRHTMTGWIRQCIV